MAKAQHVRDELAALGREQEEAKRKQEEKSSKLNERLEALRRSIRKGETTGDRVQDFFIAAYGATEHPSLPLAQKLEAELKGKTGELVLVITNTREYASHSFLHGSSDPHLRTLRFIGRLADDKLALDLKESKAALPTTAFIMVGRSVHREESQFELGSYWSGNHGLDELHERMAAGRDYGSALRILVGTKAVFEFDASKVDEEHRDFFFDRDNWVVLSHWAARQLGMEVPWAPEEEKYRESERDEARKELNGKRDEYRAYRRAIGAVESDERYRGDEAFVAPYGEAKKCLERLRHLVAYAKALGLEDDPIVKLVESELPKEKAST